MNIGELATRSGHSRSSIRFYERIGLLPAVDRRANGYRTYPDQTLVVLELIGTAQNAGFSLDEIRLLLPDGKGNWQHDALIAALRAKVIEIERLERQLALSKANLKRSIESIESKPDDIDCAANAKRVLSTFVGG